MTTGWPQNQNDLRWPYADNDDTGPAGSLRGRLATETDPGIADAPMFGADHPSGPLPIGPMLDPRQSGRSQSGRPQSDRQRGDKQQRGRLGRKSRGGRDEFEPVDGAAGDADYDWIKYLGEAGPAQEADRRQSGGRASGKSAPAPSEPRSPRTAGPSPSGPSSTVPSLPARSGRSPSADSQATRFFDTAETDRTRRVTPADGMPQASASGAAAPVRPDLPSRDRARRDERPEARPAADYRRSDVSRSGPWDQPRQTGTWETGSAWPETARPADSQPFRSPQAAAPSTDAPPSRQRRQQRWTPIEERNDSADSPATFGRSADTDVRRSRSPRPATSVDVATAAILPEHDFEPDLAPAKPDGRGKKAGSRKPARKARRSVGRPAAGRPARAQASAGRAATAPWDVPSTPAPASPAPASPAPARAALTTPRPTAPRPATRPRRGTARRAGRRQVHLVIGAAVVLVLAVAGFLVRGMFAGSGPAHTISTPAKLNAYALQPQLAKSMGAQALRAAIVKKGSGEATHVVDAVYEVSTGPAAKSGPLFILFIGGNLSGSASSFISSFTGLLPGAFVTSAGSLGGQAACVPGYSGHPAECAWADNDTFGLFASPTLSASALGNELRAMRPLVEHVRK
jgi:hypothetical protein